jgi:hypothetical protein
VNHFKIHPITLLLLPLLLSGCSLDEQLLEGSWQAIALYENGKKRTVPLDEVQLHLGPESAYRFTSVGFYEEKGHFRSSAKFLFLTDTSTTPNKEHVIKVLFLSEDTLKIRMMQDSARQALFLTRINESQ